MNPENEQKPRVQVPEEKAIDLLPEGDTIHTFRVAGHNMIGADWSRERILDRIKTHGVEYSGDNARRLNHGLCSWDTAAGWLFIETRREKK